MLNKALKQVVNNIYAEKEKLKNQLETEDDGYRKIDLEFQLNTVESNRLYKVYSEFIENFPEDSYDQLKEIVVDILGSEENYERLFKNVSTVIKKPTVKDMSKSVASVTIVEKFDKIVDKLSNFVSDETMNKIAENVKNYIPAPIDNTPIHPLASTIEEIKDSNKFKELTQAERIKIAKELDEINEVVKESPRKYSEVQTDFDKYYEHVTNKDNDKFFQNYISEENKDFGKAFIYRDLGFVMKDDIADDQEKISIAKSPAFKLTNNTQASILKVWKKMDELGIISAGDGKETGSKIYGFEKLYNARKKIDDALNKQQFDNLQALKDEYEKQLQNMREMYRIIKTELNPSPKSIPGNVQNFRENFVPAEFKNDICINATVNGMYNTYSIVKSMGVTPEEFLSNPQRYIDKNFNDELTKFYIDKLYKDLSFEDTLLKVYNDKSKEGLNSHGMPRMVATLTLFEKDDEQRKNNIIYHAVQSGKIESIFNDANICYNYFSQEKTNTFVNVLFANPEDKNFYTLRAYDSVTSDKTHKIKAFDFANYIQEKKIPAENIYQRVTSFLTKAYTLAYTSEKRYSKERAIFDKQAEKYRKGKIKKYPEHPKNKEMSIESFVQMVKDIQQGVMAYSMLATSDMQQGMDKLTEFLKDPASALKNLNIDNTFALKLAALKNKDIVLNENIQRATQESGLNIKDLRIKENTYNKNAERIIKEANKISAKVASEKNAKKIEELQKQLVLKMNELKQLQQAETERLATEYKSGNIPAEYYQKRVENILGLKHNDKIAIFDDGLDKNQYIKSTNLEQLSKNEKDRLFNCEVEKQKEAKQIFCNKQFLQKNNLVSTNKDFEIDVQKANFKQIDVSEIESIEQNNKREPLVVDEAKLETSSQKSEPQNEIDPKQTVKMP